MLPRGLILALALLAGATGWASQCGPSGCWPTPTPSVSMARVSHADGRGASHGTATLVAHRGERSYFLTCAHVFEGAGQTRIALPGSAAVAGTVVAIDRRHDLAVIETARVSAAPVEVEWRPSGELTACGFGPTGQRRCVRGPIVGYATPRGADSPSLRMRGTVRPGDSGGPVLNSAGRLVGVVWGARGGETYASFGGPLQRILSRLTQGERAQEGSRIVRRPEGRTETPAGSMSGWTKEFDRRMEATDRRIAAIDSRVTAGFAAVEKRLDGLAPASEVHALGERTGRGIAGLRDRIEGLTRLVGVARNAVAKPLLSVETLGLLAALGLAAAGVVLGTSLWRRRRRRRPESATLAGRPIAVDTPPPPQRVTPETHFVPYATDDFARAHQWAGEQLARKFPGSVEWLASLDSLIKQQLAGKK